MATIVEQLQLDAANSSVTVTTLLRRAKIAAAKLRLDKIEHWMELELTGYARDVPAYRKTRGQLRGWNPYNGWIPINGHPETMEILCSVESRESVSQIEEIVARSDGGFAAVPLSPSKTSIINKNIGVDLPRYEIIISLTTLTGILDHVRNSLLDWSLNLEKIGVVGASFSFSMEEQEKARGATNMTFNVGNIGSFVGNLGSKNSSGLINTGNFDVQVGRKFAEQLKTQTRELAAAGADEMLLKVASENLQRELAKNKPNGRIIDGIVGDIRNSLDGALGNILASGVLYEIGRIFGA